MDYDCDDGYVVDLESDQEEAADSSDDEINIVLHGTPEQRRKLKQQYNMDQTTSITQKRKSAGNEDDSSEDEFEKEMTAELNATMSTIEKEHMTGPTPGSSTAGSKKVKSDKEEPAFYDKDYFDSDSDEEGNKEKTKKRPVLTNDDLLYDPDADDDDQTWVDDQRRQYQPQGVVQRTGAKTIPKAQRLPNSDAVLNCPACMIQLCLDCQRHAKYNHQYRAMFVMNCVVNHEQRLKFPKQKQNNKKKKRTEENIETAATADPKEELYHPVRCSQCNTEVAVFDKDEVFHFFNVLASHS